MERYFVRFFVELDVHSFTLLVQCFLGGLASSSKLSTSDSSSLLLLLSLETHVDEVLALLKLVRISIVLKSKILYMPERCLIAYIFGQM